MIAGRPAHRAFAGLWWLLPLLFACHSSPIQEVNSDAGHDFDAGSMSTTADAGVPVSDCAGAVTVQKGFLASGAQAWAVTAFSPSGSRVLMATTLSAGCNLETSTGITLPWSGTAANLRITFPPNLQPGTYLNESDGGFLFMVDYSYADNGTQVGNTPLVSGSIAIDSVDGGISGRYYLDFGPSQSPSISGDVIEEGSFSAPVCDFCAQPAQCGDGGCDSDEVCFRDCGGPVGKCVPRPPCDGAPACQSCTLPSSARCQNSFQGGGGGCEVFDGLSIICSCLP
jgi:hypothetical protein